MVRVCEAAKAWFGGKVDVGIYAIEELLVARRNDELAIVYPLEEVSHSLLCCVIPLTLFQFAEDPIPGSSRVIKDFIVQILLRHYDPFQHWFGLRPPLSAVYMANIELVVSLQYLSQGTY